MRSIAFYLVVLIAPIHMAFGATFDINKINREIDVKGYDVRMHSDQYSLFIGVENSLIQERPYKLMKKTANGYKTVSEGEVISVEPTSPDHQEVFNNPDVQIQLRKPVKFKDKTKQIVVFKFRGEGLEANKAIAFEEIQ